MKSCGVSEGELRDKMMYSRCVLFLLWGTESTHHSGKGYINNGQILSVAIKYELGCLPAISFVTVGEVLPG